MINIFRKKTYSWINFVFSKILKMDQHLNQLGLKPDFDCSASIPVELKDGEWVIFWRTTLFLFVVNRIFFLWNLLLSTGRFAFPFKFFCSNNNNNLKISKLSFKKVAYKNLILWCTYRYSIFLFNYSFYRSRFV